MMTHVRRLIISGMMIGILVGSVAAQGRKLYPVDNAARDPTFKAFRNRLIAAASRKDKEFVLSIIDPKIELSFGGHSGIKDFKEMWKIDRPDSKFWSELTTILKLGGSFRTVEGHKEFVAPYVTSNWPEKVELDVFDYLAVIGANVRLRKSPGIKAPVVTSLTYDIVKLADGQPVNDAIQKDGLSWIKIVTVAGEQGYIADKYVRRPIDYRAYFRKINGSWRMTAFIAGD